MPKNKKQLSFEKGFTLIEVLFVIIIIGILAAIILTALKGVQQRARDYGAYASMKSTISPAYMCLMSTGFPDLTLADPGHTTSICVYNSGSNDVTGISAKGWPNFTIYGEKWRNILSFDIINDDGFYWCPPGTSLNGTHPASVGVYADGTMGGSTSSASFCYMLKNGTKYIWCTESGCKKEGF